MWSAEKRAEGLECMHPKPSSPSGRFVGMSDSGVPGSYELSGSCEVDVGNRTHLISSDSQAARPSPGYHNFTFFECNSCEIRFFLQDEDRRLMVQLATPE